MSKKKAEVASTLFKRDIRDRHEELMENKGRRKWTPKPPVRISEQVLSADEIARVEALYRNGQADEPDRGVRIYSLAAELGRGMDTDYLHDIDQEMLDGVAETQSRTPSVWADRDIQKALAPTSPADSPDKMGDSPWNRKPPPPKTAFGTRDGVAGLLFHMQLVDIQSKAVAALDKTQGVPERVATMLDLIEEIRPQDPLEGMAATQATAVHMVAMDLLARASRADGMAVSYVDAARKLLDTFRSHMEALDKRRGKGNVSRQEMKVQHVHIEGGQAIVGPVDAGGRNGSRKRGG